MKGRHLLDLREERILHFDVQMRQEVTGPPFVTVVIQQDGAEDSLALQLAEGQAETLLILLEQQFGRKRHS